MQREYRGGHGIVTMLDRCRALRMECTDAERLLWRLLRNRQVAGAKFRRQHQYGPYILDFYCSECRLAIEADGGQHFSDSGIAMDATRTRYLQASGVNIFRFSNVEVLHHTEEVLQAIWRAVAQNERVREWPGHLG